MDFSSFYTDTGSFKNYSSEHFIALFVVSVIGVIFIYFGKHKWNNKQKWRYALYASAFLYFTQLFKLFIRMYLGNVDYTTDLPLHLCNFLPLLMFIGLYKRSRSLLAIISFWILAGTFQANITPTLTDVLPHYEAIRYWSIHTGLPVIVVYVFYVLGYRFTFRDAIKSALALNVIAIIVYPINLLLGANYLFLIAKPPPGTIYDLLGPWPWYILSLEVIMLVLFFITLIPFSIYLRFNPDKKPENITPSD